MGKIDSIADIQNCNGLIDTAIGLFFEDFAQLYQDINWVVIERPLDDVKSSLARIGWPTWGTDALAKSLVKVKERAKLVVPFKDIDKRAPEIWKVCEIPYDFNRKYWTSMSKQNLQYTALPEKEPVLFKELLKRIG